MECEICGKSLKSKSARAKYCSNACKQEAHRQRHGLEKPEFIKATSEKKKEVNFNVDTELSGYLDKIQTLDSEIEYLEARKGTYLKKLTDIGTNESLLNDTLGFAGIGLGLATKTEKPGEKFAAVALALLAGKAISNNVNYDAINRSRGNKRRIYRAKIREIDEQINERLLNKTLLQKQYDVLKDEFKKHFDNFLQVKYLEEQEKENLKALKVSNMVYSIEDIKDIDHEEIFEFGSPLRELIGDPSATFKMLVYGVSGQGKTTWCLNLANEFAEKHGTVLFNSSEEGISNTLRRKLMGYTSKNLFLSQSKNFTELKELLSIQNYDLVVIDSLNDMNITKDEFDELKDFKNAFIFINQATKDGNYKGGTKFAHDSDIVIKIDNYEPIVEKTRFK